MKTKKYKRFSFCVVFLVIFAILFAQITAFGAQTRSKQLRLTIESTYDDNPIENEEFELFEFARVSDNGDMIVDEEFDDYSVDFENMTEDNWKDYAEIITAYAQRDDITPECSGETDDNGIIVFSESNSNLTDAVYLVVGETVDDGNTRYSCEPFFLSLPAVQDGEYVYDETVNPKILVDEVPVTTQVKVLKVWDDESDTSKRPESIEVQLLKDGEVYKTETLNKDNNWRFTWNELEGKNNWSVVEKSVPNGYTVTLNTDSNLYTLTNKLTPSTTVPAEPGTPVTVENPSTPETTTSQQVSTTTPDTPVTTQAPETPVTSESTTSATPSTPDTKLPRTGLNWLPVPILLIAGISLVIFGIVRNKNGEKKYESE